MTGPVLYSDSGRQQKCSQSSSSLIIPGITSAQLLPPVETSGVWNCALLAVVSWFLLLEGRTGQHVACRPSTAARVDRSCRHEHDVEVTRQGPVQRYPVQFGRVAGAQQGRVGFAGR